MVEAEEGGLAETQHAAWKQADMLEGGGATEAVHHHEVGLSMLSMENQT